jgi:protocatechuate 3,4-dioxygenase beta subunit
MSARGVHAAGRRSDGKEDDMTTMDETAVAPTELLRTPDQILGPFYPLQQTPVRNGDLTEGGRAVGTVLRLDGRVLTSAGAPVPGAQVEIWQANAQGRYAHPNDTNPTPLDPHFSGFAVTITDKDGRYQFKTVRPAAYPAGPDRMRPAHVHFKVTGAREQLVTQMYFVGEEWNDRDPWLQSARRKDVLIVDPQDVPGETGVQAVTFDIVLMHG